MKRLVCVLSALAVIICCCGNFVCAAPTAVTASNGKVTFNGDTAFVSLRSDCEVALKYNITEDISSGNEYTFSVQLMLASDSFDYSPMYIGVRVSAGGTTQTYKSKSFKIINNEYTTCSFSSEISYSGKLNNAEMFFANANEDEMLDVFIKNAAVTEGTTESIAFSSLTAGAIHKKYSKTELLPFCYKNNEFLSPQSYIGDELLYARYAGLSFFAYYPENDDYTAHFNTETTVKACFIINSSARLDTSLFDNANYLTLNGRPIVFVENAALLDYVKNAYSYAIVIPIADSPQGDISAVHFEGTVTDATVLKYRQTGIVPIVDEIISPQTGANCVSGIRKICSIAEENANIVLFSSWNDIASGQYIVPTYKSGDKLLDVERLRYVRKGLTCSARVSINTAAPSEEEAVYEIPSDSAGDETDTTPEPYIVSVETPVSTYFIGNTAEPTSSYGASVSVEPTATAESVTATPTPLYESSTPTPNNDAQPETKINTFTVICVTCGALLLIPAARSYIGMKRFIKKVKATYKKSGKNI